MNVRDVSIYVEAVELHPLLTPRNDKVIELDSSARPGRKQLVEQLFERHAPVLRRFLRGQSVPPEDTEELVQELFTRLMGVARLEERMTDATGSVRSYLLTMANNLIVDQERKRQVRDAYAAREIDGEPTDERSPEQIVAAQLELEAIRAVILDMPLNWRVALILQRFRNMSYEEIALHMGVQSKQVDNYLVRALRRLRKARRKIDAAGERPC